MIFATVNIGEYYRDGQVRYASCLVSAHGSVAAVRSIGPPTATSATRVREMFNDYNYYDNNGHCI